MALVKCKVCGKGNQASTCPTCGAEISLKISVMKFIVRLFFGGIAFLFFTATNPGSGITFAAGSSATAVKSLEATNITFSKGQHRVTGKVINTTGKKLAYAQVEINFFDNSGIHIGSTMAKVLNLESGVSWAFEAPVLDDRTVTVKVAGIVAY